MTGKTRPLQLVIDQGGQSSRALVFNRQGTVLAEAALAIDTVRHGTDRVEHSAAEILSSIRTVVTQVSGSLEPLSIENVGLACQRSSIVCWNRHTGRALSPVLSWQDRRAAYSLAELATEALAIHENTGLFLSPHYGASKLAWCLEYLDDVRIAWEQGRLAFGPLSSFLLFNLLEEKPLLVDPVAASRTLLWNLQSRDWDPALLAMFEIPQHALPRCVPNRFDYGHYRVAAQRIPLTVSTGDQPAALYMAGLPAADTLYINIGTGAFLQRMTGKQVVLAPRLLSSVSWQAANDIDYVLEGTVNGAASALQQVSEELGVKKSELNELLAGALEQVISPPLFLNGVSGVGSPYWLADFPSRFVGSGSTGEKLVAVIESIVFLLQANIDEMNPYVDAPRRILLSGGLSALDGLCQRLANLSGLALERTDQQEATARGLAWLLSKSPRYNESGYTTFTARKDPGLRERYRQWQGHMMQ